MCIKFLLIEAKYIEQSFNTSVMNNIKDFKINLRFFQNQDGNKQIIKT